MIWPDWHPRSRPAWFHDPGGCAGTARRRADPRLIRDTTAERRLLAEGRDDLGRKGRDAGPDVDVDATGRFPRTVVLGPLRYRFTSWRAAGARKSRPPATPRSTVRRPPPARSRAGASVERTTGTSASKPARRWPIAPRPIAFVGTPCPGVGAPRAHGDRRRRARLVTDHDVVVEIIETAQIGRQIAHGAHDLRARAGECRLALDLVDEMGAGNRPGSASAIPRLRRRTAARRPAWPARPRRRHVRGAHRRRRLADDRRLAMAARDRVGGPWSLRLGGDIDLEIAARLDQQRRQRVGFFRLRLLDDRVVDTIAVVADRVGERLPPSAHRRAGGRSGRRLITTTPIP